MKYLLFTLVLLSLVAFAPGCASGPALEKYPERYIDRPYTLPKGVDAWQTIMTTGYVRDDFSSLYIFPLPIPLTWRQSLSSTWTLVWSPLPLSVEHQIFNNGKHRLGLDLGLGAMFLSNAGFGLIPHAGGHYRYRMAEKWALENRLEYDSVYFMRSGRYGWSVGYSVGPLLQLSHKFAISPRVSLQVTRAFRFNRFDGSPIDQSVLTTAPLGLWAGWAFSRQWNLEADYRYAAIGYTDHFASHMGVLTLSHYW